MIFRQSAVAHLDRECVVEAWERMPRDIHPALLGTGRIALGLDATGMQGLNCCLGQYRDCAAFEHSAFYTEKDLYLYREEVLSQHQAKDPWGTAQFANMPCGWLDYRLELDGAQFDAERLVAEATDWRREFRPREGLLKTAYTVAGVRIAWIAGMRRDGEDADFTFRATARDGRAHRVGLAVVFHFTLRDGRPLFRGGLEAVTSQAGFIGAHWEGTDQTSSARLKHPVGLSYALTCSGGGRGELQPGALCLTWCEEGVEVAADWRLVSGSSRRGTDVVAQVLTGGGGLPAVVDSWRTFFEQAAEIGVGSPQKEFLVAMNQYLLRAGLPWSSGLPLGTLWTGKFGSMTFWDSFFASDGMLRAGHVAPVRAFCDWLVRTARPHGRAHMWMTWYDGDTNCNPADDLAYQSCLAFAGVGIRLYEQTRDPADLAERTLPYLQLVARFLVDDVFRFDPERGWELAGTVGADIGVQALRAAEQNDQLLWAVMTLAKYGEYAGDTLAARCREIANWFREHRIRLNITDVWYPWLPYLAPAFPFADFTSWWSDDRQVVERFMILPCEPETFARITGPTPDMPLKPLIGTYTGMAWGNTSTAAALTIAGQRDLALEFLDGAHKFVSGLGYLSESPYEMLAGGNTPYVPSCGSYLSSVLVMLAQSSLWENETRVGVDMPRFWAFQRIWFKNVRTFNGSTVSMTYEPFRARIEVENARAHTLRARIPARMAGEPIRVTCNGAFVEAAVDGEGIVLPLPAGRHVLEIARDLVTSTDVTVIEPFDQGAALCDIVRATGHSVRWLRDVDGLAKVASATYVVHVSFVNLPADVTRRLEAAVSAGATLITLFHAGVSHYSPEMAALTGLNGRVEDVWCFDSRPSEWKVNLPGLPERLQIHTAAKDLLVAPEADVEVLGTLTHSGVPALTRRRVGKGTVWWLACGNKIMDRSPALGWGLHLPREVFVYGITREAHAKLHWLTSPDFARLMECIVNAKEA